MTKPAMSVTEALEVAIGRLDYQGDYQEAAVLRRLAPFVAVAIREAEWDDERGNQTVLSLAYRAMKEQADGN